MNAKQQKIASALSAVAGVVIIGIGAAADSGGLAVAGLMICLAGLLWFAAVRMMGGGI